MEFVMARFHSPLPNDDRARVKATDATSENARRVAVNYLERFCSDILCTD